MRESSHRIIVVDFATSTTTEAGLMTKLINWRNGLATVAAVAAIVGTARTASADAIPYPDAGTPNPVTYTFTATATTDVIAYFAGSSAGYDEQLGMLDNGVLTSAGFGLDDHTSVIGQHFDLGHVTAGDTLTFVLDVISPALGFVYSNPALNVGYDSPGDTLGHNHVYSVPYTATSPVYAGIPVGTYVGFEDLPFPDSDFNYFDETYVFTDLTASTAVPEPASLILLAVGLIGIAAIRRRKPA
jgi:hypothetical protein